MIELANGATYIANGCSARDNALWIYLSDVIAVNDVISAFTPDNTNTIKYIYGEMEDVYSGFTRIVQYSTASGFFTSICLVKE